MSDVTENEEVEQIAAVGGHRCLTTKLERDEEGEVGMDGDDDTDRSEVSGPAGI